MEERWWRVKRSWLDFIFDVAVILGAAVVLSTICVVGSRWIFPVHKPEPSCIFRVDYDTADKLRQTVSQVHAGDVVEVTATHGQINFQIKRAYFSQEQCRTNEKGGAE